MRRRVVVWLAVVSAAGLGSTDLVHAADARYVAVLADGTRIEGRELSGWGNPGENPSLDDKPLFAAQHPLRWLRDRSLRPHDARSDNSPYLEFVNGDRLPGRIMGYEEAVAMPAATVPGHLTVILKDASMPQGMPLAPKIRVLPRLVRRIVWARTKQRPYEPGTLFYQDGRRLMFQAVRWQKDGFRLLLEDGTRDVLLADLAEIHFPREDAWDDYCHELAIVNPDCSARMTRLETTRGLIVSTAAALLRPAGGGDRNNWHHVLQPAWSLDPIWVPFLSIRARWEAVVGEMPLSRLVPTRFTERPILGKGWSWQVDRNVEEGPLENARGPHGWGFGVHAPCELWFELPAGTTGFRSLVGLDSLAGDGGCARGLVYLDRPEGRPLFTSKPLIGSRETADTGNLALGGSGAKRTLILAADAMETTAPAGADPLDIRDMLDWIEPVVQLDGARLKADVRKALPSTVPAWSGWRVIIDDKAFLQATMRLEHGNVAILSHARGIGSDNHKLTLTTTRELSEDDGWLVVRMRTIAQGGKRGRFEVLLDERPIARFESPPRDNATTFCVPLLKFQGQKVKLELVYQPGDSSESLDWQSLLLFGSPSPKRGPPSGPNPLGVNVPLLPE